MTAKLTPAQQRAWDFLRPTAFVADWLVAEHMKTNIRAASRVLNGLEEKGLATMSYRLGTKYWRRTDGPLVSGTENGSGARR